MFSLSSPADPLQLALAGSLLMGCAVFLLISRVLMLVERHIRTSAEEWEFEQTRRVRLRLGSKVYRLTEPLIDELSAVGWLRLFPLDSLQTAINRRGTELPWHAREFVAVALMEGLLWTAGISFFGTVVLPLMYSFLVGIVLAAVWLQGRLRTPCMTANERLRSICRRLPCGIDLIALMMRAGAGLQEALRTVVEEAPEHPFSQEFRQVLHDFSRGKPLYDSLADLDQRLQSPEMHEAVLAIQKSLELGTPLAGIFSNLAEQLRLRKSQWAETETSRAKVRIQGPTIVILIACMLTIAAPFFFELTQNSNPSQKEAQADEQSAV